MLDTVIDILGKAGINNTTDLAACTYGQRALIAECIRYLKLDKQLLASKTFQNAVVDRLKTKDATEIYIHERIESGELLLH